MRRRGQTSQSRTFDTKAQATRWARSVESQIDLSGIATDSHQGLDDDVLVGPGEGEIAEPDEGGLDPGVTGCGVAQYRKGHRLGAGQELGQLIRMGKIVEVHEGLHLPIMNKNPVRVQTHFILETRTLVQTHFILILDKAGN